MNQEPLVCGLDIETYYDQQYSLRSMSTWEYITDPRFRIEGVGVRTTRCASGNTGFMKNLVSKWMPTPGQTIKQERSDLRSWLSAEGYTSADFACAHNGAFDFSAIGFYTGLVPKRMMCTQLMALYFLGSPSVVGRYKNLPGGTNSLESLSAFFNRSKDVEALTNTKGRHVEDFTAEERMRWLAYMESDVDNMLELLDVWWGPMPRIQAYAINWSLRQMAFPVLRFNSDRAEAEVEYAKNVTEAKLARYGVTGEVFRSADKFAELMSATGYSTWPNITTPKGNVKPLLSKAHPLWKQIRTSPDTPQHTKDLMDLRDEVNMQSRDKRIPRYATIARRLSGAFPVHVMPSGAHTHRLTGGSGAGGNQLNMPSEGVIRQCVEAPPGCVLAVFDFTGKELRVSRWVAHDEPAKQMVLSGIDMYSQFVAVMQSKSIEQVTPLERKKIGKLAHLSCQYGTGKQKASEALECTLDEAMQVVNSFRYTQHPALPAAWKICDQLLRIWCGGAGEWSQDYSGYFHKHLNIPGAIGWRHIQWPSGRELMYPNMSTMPSDDPQRPGNDIIYRRRGPTHEPKKIYGALLFENIVQSLANEIMWDKQYRIENHLGITVALQVYDEIVCVVNESVIQDQMPRIKAILEQPLSWWPDGPPLEADGSTAKTYAGAK